MCNPGAFINSVFSIGGNGAGGAAGSGGGAAAGGSGRDPAPAPSPAPAPAPSPAPAPAPGPAPDYTALAKGYTDYARPQIDTQYGHAADALTTGLADRGLASSNIGSNYHNTLDSAYQTQLTGLPTAADTYAHGDTSKGFTPLGDLFTKLINPVATFNANNRYQPLPGQPYAGAAGAVGSGGSTGSPNVNLATGSSSRVVN